MSFSAEDMKYLLSTGDASVDDFSVPQNNKYASHGGKCSTTEFTEGLDNLFKEWTLDQLDASDRYACICIRSVSTTDVLDAVRFLAKEVNTYPSGVSIFFGVQTNDEDTAAPVLADEFTSPVGITFVSLVEWSGDPVYDRPAGYPIGPLNSPADGNTDLTIDGNEVIFLYIKFSCNTVVDSLDGLSFTAPIIAETSGAGLPFALPHALGAIS